MEFFVIYGDHPNFPGRIVSNVQLLPLAHGHRVFHATFCTIYQDLNHARWDARMHGFEIIGAMPGEDPSIIEVWL